MSSKVSSESNKEGGVESSKEESKKSRIRERSRELDRLHMQYLTRASISEDTFQYIKDNIFSMSEEIERKLENIYLKPSTCQINVATSEKTF